MKKVISRSVSLARVWLKNLKKYVITEETKWTAGCVYAEVWRGKTVISEGRTVGVTCQFRA